MLFKTYEDGIVVHKVKSKLRIEMFKNETGSFLTLFSCINAIFLLSVSFHVNFPAPLPPQQSGE